MRKWSTMTQMLMRNKICITTSSITGDVLIQQIKDIKNILEDNVWTKMNGTDFTNISSVPIW